MQLLFNLTNLRCNNAILSPQKENVYLALTKIKLLSNYKRITFKWSPTLELSTVMK